MDILENIKVFYDGVLIEKYGKLPYVKGFTTNTSFMKAGNKLNYTTFFNENKETINNRPFSLQIFEDDYDKAYEQAMIITSLGDNVYVKVPIITSTGQSNIKLISKLLYDNIKVNITAIFTKDQIDLINDLLNDISTPVIVSIFAGRIIDTCIDPAALLKYSSLLFKQLSHVEILWAGCKDIMSIKTAIDTGCHIITIPDSILDRVHRINKDLTEFSLETVQCFKHDAVQGNIILQ